MHTPSGEQTRPASRGTGWLRPIAAAIALVALAGCTATPDWADPTRWGEEAPAPPAQVSPDPAAEAGTDSFPNLASVPDARPSVSSPAARAQLREGLAADRSNAQYTDERLMGDTRDQSPPRVPTAEPDAAVVAEAPPPPSVAADIAPTPPPPATPTPSRPAAEVPDQPPLPAPPSTAAPAAAEAPGTASRASAAAETAPVSRVRSVPRRVSPRIVERVPAEEGEDALGEPASAALAPSAPPSAAMPTSPPSPPRVDATETAAPVEPPVPDAPGQAADGVPTVSEAQRSEAGLSAAQSAAVQRALAARAARLSGRDVGSEEAVPAGAVPPLPRTFASSPSPGAPPQTGTRTVPSSPALAAIAPPPTPAVPSGQSELAGVVYFPHGSATLDSSDWGVLRDIVALHRQRGGVIRLVGHASARTGNADPVAHRVANLEMSQKRAGSVASALVRLGVARANVLAEARADSQPVYHEFMPSGEAGNRRVEIFLES